MTRHVTVSTIKPHTAQKLIESEAGLYNVVDFGRRCGKTTYLTYRAMNTSLSGFPVGIFMPSYNMSINVWNELNFRLAPVIAKRSVQNMRIDLINKGFIKFWSLESPQKIRGSSFKTVLCDEVAIVPGFLGMWDQIIQPLTLDFKDSDAWFFSTPQGFNDFWELYRRGQDELMPDWKCWKIPTTSNPYLNAEKIQKIKAEVPPNVWEQEYEANFVMLSGSVFENVVECATAKTQLKGNPKHIYCFAVDWGQSNDFTVCIVIDLTLGEMCYMDRFNKMSYVDQKSRLINLYKKFRPTNILCEENSMGRPMIDVLAEEGLPVTAFNTNSGSKQAIIRDLQSSFAQKSIRIIADQTLINELNSFQSKKLLSGVYSFEAPRSSHDDCVISLAISHTMLYSGNSILFGDKER